MAAPLLSSTQYPAIRAAIHVGLDTNQLPDATIALDIFLQAAINDVLEQDADAETRTGDEETRVTSAGIFFCAARLCAPVAPVIWNSQKTMARDFQYSRQPFDPERRAEELRGLAAKELAAVLEPSEETPRRPTMFTVGVGRRGV